MKYITKPGVLLSAMMLFILMPALSQIPQKINYQAVARDGAGNVLANQAVTVRLSILTGTSSGVVQYSETHASGTNAFGLFTLQVGSGTVVSGNFSSITWNSGSKFLKVEIDPAGGSNYIDLGATELISVPYALWSENSNTPGPQGPAGSPGSNGATWIIGTGPPSAATGVIGDLFLDNSNGDYYLKTGGSTWTVQGNITGPSGAPGTNGTNGTNGIDGATWLTGSGAPSGATGNVNDLYLNTSNGNYYKKTGVSTWTLQGNLTGPQGVPGANGSQGPPGILLNGNTAGNTPYWDGTTWVVNSSNIYNNGGNVGVNTTAPSGKFHIKGSTNASQLIVDANSTQSNTNPLIKLRSSGGTELMWIHSDDSTNVYLGLNAGSANNLSGGGAANTLIGYKAGVSNTTGWFNTAIGWKSLASNTSGANLTAIGAGALYSNTTGIGNTATGLYSLYSNSTGGHNTAGGWQSLYTNSTGSLNTAFGSSALHSNSTGAENVAIGFQSLYTNQTGNGLTAIGFEALYGNDSSGTQNTAVGYRSQRTNSTGYSNTSVGSLSLSQNVNGARNTALGASALYNNTSGWHNTAIGQSSLSTNSTGGNNTSIGSETMLLNTTGYQNTAIGNWAMEQNTTGFGNTAVGYLALQYLTTGNNNLSIGANSGTINTLTSAYNTTSINNLGVGNNDNNNVFIGNTSVVWIGGEVTWGTYSDERMKRNIKENVPGLVFITRLKPVTYNLDIRRQAELTGNAETPDYPSKYDIEKITMTGFLAQDVAKAAAECNYNFSGVRTPQNEKMLYTLSYEQFVVPLVKAVQEQQIMIEILVKENEMIKRQLEQLMKK